MYRSVRGRTLSQRNMGIIRDKKVKGLDLVLLKSYNNSNQFLAFIKGVLWFGERKLP
jgi:hypothetical protein